MQIASRVRHPLVWLPISGALLALLVWRSRLWEVGPLLADVEPAPILAALAVCLLVPVLWAIRSSELLRAVDQHVGVLPLIPMTAFANTVNNMTPGSTGEVFRLWLLRAHHDVPYAIGGAVILIERLVAFAYLAGSAVLLWLAYLGVLPPVLAGVLVVLLLASPAIVYRIGVRPSRIVAWVPLGRLLGADRWSRFVGFLARVDETIAILMTHPGRVAAFALTTAGLLACYAFQLVLVGRGLGVALDPIAAWGALGIALTAGVLSMLPFGLGSADLVLVALLGVAGVPGPEAAAMAFGYRLVSTLPLGLIGVASYAWLSARLPTEGLAEGEVGAALAAEEGRPRDIGASIPPPR
jgi:uncharacterized protein (TIRG00374 family)